MGLIANRLRNSTTSPVQAEDEMWNEYQQSLAADNSGGSEDTGSDGGGGSSVMDQLMAGDIKGLFHRIDDYYTNNALKRAEELKDDDGNVTPESVSEAENGSNYGYDATGSTPFIDPNSNYDYSTTEFADNLPGHIGRDFRDWSNTVGQDVTDVINSGGSEGKWKLYEDAVANPGMKIAATPFLPAPARIAAGIAAAPAFVSDAINLGRDGYDGETGDGSGGILGAAKNIERGLVEEPLEQLGNAAMHPMDTLDRIYEHPANFWNDILEPGMVVEGGLRAGKKANSYAYDHSAKVRSIEDPVSETWESGKDWVSDTASRAGEAVFDGTATAADYATRPLSYVGEQIPHNIIEDTTWQNRRSAEYRPEEVETEPERALDIDTGSEYDAAINEACAKYGLDPALGHAVAQMESQHGRSTSNVFGVNGISDPYESIDIGVKSLKRCIEDNGGDIDAGLREYNGNANPEYTSTVHQIENEYGGGRRNSASWDIDMSEVGNTMDNHSVGCVEAVTKLGKNNDFLGRELNNGVVGVPKLIEDAKAEGRYMDYDPSKLERGDVIVFDGDEHVMMYAGDGRIVGNSSSLDRIVERGLNEQGQMPTGIIKAGGARGRSVQRFDDRDAQEAEEQRSIAEQNSHAFDDINKGIDEHMNEDWAPQEKEAEAKPAEQVKPLVDENPAANPTTNPFLEDKEAVHPEEEIQQETGDTAPIKKIPASIFNDMSDDVKACFDIKDMSPETEIKEAEAPKPVSNTAKPASFSEERDPYLQPVSDATIKAMPEVYKNQGDIAVSRLPKSEQEVIREAGFTYENEQGVEMVRTEPLVREAQARGLTDMKLDPPRDMDVEYTDEGEISFSKTKGASTNTADANKKTKTTSVDAPELPEYTKPKNTLDDIIRKQDIVERFEELFGTPIRDGHGRRGTDGYYLKKQGAIRLSNWGDLVTMAHEIGHKISDHMPVPTPAGPLFKELKENVERIHGKDAYKPAQMYREGPADFMSEYLNEGPEVAKEHFPKYYEAFQGVLAKNEDMRRRIDDMADLYQRYHAQTPEQKALSGVISGRLPDKTTWKEKARDAAHKAEELFIDDKAPLREIDKARSEILGRELTPEESVYKRARLATGSAATRADMLVSGKHPEMVRDAINKVYGEGTVEHAVTLKDTLSRLKKEMKQPENKAYLDKTGVKSGVQALDVLLAAQRFREMQDNLAEKIKAQTESVREHIAQQGESAENTVFNETIDKIVEDLTESNEDIGRAVSDYLQTKGYKPATFREKLVREAQEQARSQEEFGNLCNTIDFSGMNAGELLNNVHDALTQFHTKTLEDFPASFDMNDAQRIIDNAPISLKKAADDVHKMSDNVLKILQKTGMISEEHLAKMRETYKNYFPLATDYQNDAGMARAFGPQGFANIGDPIKSIIGKDESEKRQPIKSPMEMVVRNTYALLDKAERNVVAQTVVKGLKEIDKDSGNAVYAKGAGKLIEEVKAAPDEHESIFAVWENGERHCYQTDKDVYRALMSCTTPAETNFAIKIMRFPTQLLRTAATMMPDFAVRNAVRDAATSRVFMKNFMDTFNPKKPGYLNALYHIINNAVRGDAVYQEYKASGALNATLVGLDHESLQSNIMKYYDGPIAAKEKAEAVFHRSLTPLRAFSQAIETLPRLSEYMRVKESTGSQVEASMAARDITMDFSRAGSAVRHWNSIDAFFNASIQETAKIVSMAKNNPKRFVARVGATIVLPSIALWYANHDQEWYRDRPDWEKNTYWFIKKGDDIIRIPKPFLLGSFGSGAERILDYLYKTGSATNGSGWLKSVAEAAVPTLLPSAFQPIIDTISNHSMWKDGPIVPRKLQNKTADQQVDENTSSLAKFAGGLAKSVGYDLSPMKVDYLGRGYLGGVYSWGTKMLDKGPVTGASEQMKKAFVANSRNSQALTSYYEAKEELDKKYNSTKVGEGIRKNADKKNYRLKQMDKTDRYNYQLLERADKKMQTINKSKMDDDEKQARKIKIARDVMKVYKR